MNIEINIKRPRTKVWGISVVIEYVSESDFAKETEKSNQKK